MFATFAPTPGPCPTTAYYFKNEHFYRSVAGKKKKKMRTCLVGQTILCEC